MRWTILVTNMEMTSCRRLMICKMQSIKTAHFAHVQSGGQSPIEKYLALTNIEDGVKAVEYFIRTGKLYPGIDWAEQL